jgi:hypothetical protein
MVTKPTIIMKSGIQALTGEIEKNVNVRAIVNSEAINPRMQIIDIDIGRFVVCSSTVSV